MLEEGRCHEEGDAMRTDMFEDGLVDCPRPLNAAD